VLLFYLNKGKIEITDYFLYSKAKISILMQLAYNFIIYKLVISKNIWKYRYKLGLVEMY